MRVRLLGSFEVSVGSQTIGRDAWRLTKAASLVKLLALAPGHRLHREQAMDVLWPDSAARAASNSLRQTLHAVRRVLDPAVGSHYLTSEDGQLSLCPEGQLWVDADAFEDAAAVARRSRDPAAYRVALDLYAGDLLPEDRYEAWAEGKREELRQLYLTLLMELARLQEERRERGPAIEALKKATAKEPPLEEAHAVLMRLYALSGRPEQALAQYERLRGVLSRGLGTEPGATTRLLRDEIAAGRLPPTPSAGAPQEAVPPDAGKHNLPAPRTSFVGREQETVEVKRTLAMTRLLTLTGAGGSGKTRLALEVARELVGVYPDGVWLVELAPLAEPELVTQAVAEAVGVPERPGEPLADTLVATLVEQELLLILDNCEHLVDAAARLVDTLLDSCPRLRVLATSREPLSLGGEVLRRVPPPLSLPDNGGERTNWDAATDGVMRYEAVRLFVDRARLRLPDFGLSQDNAGAVARVCRRLEGIPLAIELATARMGTLAVEQVAQRLEVSLDVLKGASRTATPRHQTLRATLDWSHDLLSEAEQALFRRLSVFAGGWTLEAAEAVCPSDGIERGEVLDLLGGLVEKSLVVAEAGAADGAVRYRMLVPIRQYALSKLAENGEADEMQGRRAALFLKLAEAAEQELTGHRQRLWVERLKEEHDNLREALSWALEREEADVGLRLCGALWRFWHTRGYLSEGTRWLERALSVGRGPMPARMKALEGMGWLAQRRGDTRGAEAAYEEMLALSRELDDKGNAATALNSLGTLAVAKGENERARALLEENLGFSNGWRRKGQPSRRPKGSTCRTFWASWRLTRAATTRAALRCGKKAWRWPVKSGTPSRSEQPSPTWVTPR
jgi:predicted ATPase/DNA-binding SARP family transcriptional activator